MFRVLKLLHIASLVVFLGTIITFILISTLLDDRSLENLVFARQIVSMGTRELTLPALWFAGVSGISMGLRRQGWKQPFFQFKLALTVLALINAYGFVLPAVTAAHRWAAASFAKGVLLPEYHAAAMQETIFGAVNVGIALAASVIGVWRLGWKGLRPLKDFTPSTVPLAAVRAPPVSNPTTGETMSPVQNALGPHGG
jgi:hypothetical protein